MASSATVLDTPPSRAVHQTQHDEPWYTKLVDLACEDMGGRIVFATDEWFAVADNLIKATTPIFKPAAFTECGKWMDGWESRRKRIPGHDWAIIKLGLPGVIQGIELDTDFFTGNFTPRISVQGAAIEEPRKLMALRTSIMGTAASKEALAEAEALNSAKWETLVVRSKLRPGYKETHRNFFEVSCPKRITHLRLNMFPDGGIARMRVFGHVELDWARVPAGKLMDMASAVNGAMPVSWSDAHYGRVANLLKPHRAKIMADGWETSRHTHRPAILEVDSDGEVKLTAKDWAIVQLATPCFVTELLIDTNHFKGNFPESCTIQGCNVPDAPHDDFIDGDRAATTWVTVLPRTKLSAHKEHRVTLQKPVGPISHVRLTMYPDGGISRLRMFGHAAPVSKL